jgi:hypothetical protein
MNIHNPHLEDLFLNKPERVINLPEWLLPQARIKEYRNLESLAIVEIAGRDSVAAAAKTAERGTFTDLLPTFVYTGTEHGPWSHVMETYDRLVHRLSGIRIHNLIVLGSPGFWQALNGRFIAELISRYRFYTPCIGCHLYLHSIRIPLSLMLGNVPIISGEREWHNGSSKINQTGEALDTYLSISKQFGVVLDFPLRRINASSEIRNILGFPWEQDEEQLGCVLSGNYRALSCDLDTHTWQIQSYLDEFARPCVTEILASYLNGLVPDHNAVAAQVLAQKSPG